MHLSNFEKSGFKNFVHLYIIRKFRAWDSPISVSSLRLSDEIFFDVDEDVPLVRSYPQLNHSDLSICHLKSYGPAS